MRILILTLILALAPSTVRGGSLFARSYYTHEPVRAVQIGPRPVPRAPGAVVRWGVRRQVDRGPWGSRSVVVEAWVQ